MSSQEKPPRQADETDYADAKFNEENNQVTMPKKIVELLQLKGGDRLYFSILKNGNILLLRWARPTSET